MTRLWIAALALLAIPALTPAQTVLPERVMDQYVVRQVKTLAGGVVGITVQQPAAGGSLVLFSAATVYCDAACDAEIAVDGTAATTTTAVPTPVGANRTASTAEAFTDSNLSGGTIVVKGSLSSAGQLTFDLAGVTLPSGAVASKNLTLRISSAYTGDVRLQLVFREQ